MSENDMKETLENAASEVLGSDVPEEIKEQVVETAAATVEEAVASNETVSNAASAAGAVASAPAAASATAPKKATVDLEAKRAALLAENEAIKQAQAQKKQLNKGEPTPGLGFAITAIIFGCLSIAGFFTGITVVLGVLGLIFGIIAILRGLHGGLSVAGIVTSVIGIILSILAILFWKSIADLGIGLFKSINWDEIWTWITDLFA